MRYLALLAGPALCASAPLALAAPTAQPVFAACTGAQRITCVVDGDTFWLDGTKIRIADINTPELSRPACLRERELGERAARRLVALLNAAPFSLALVARDEDRYGRKLRIVMRDGESVGNLLVAEGLAERWAGKRGDWCAKPGPA